MGSSHQQVSCYTFNDGNNWWTIKRPNREDLAVQEPIGDGVQIVHGSITGLSTLTMKEPLYLRTVKKCLAIFDYNISMSAQNLW